MNKYFRCLSVLVLPFSFLTPRIFSQPATNGGEDISFFARGPVRVFTNRDGLPQSTVYAIATDSSGRLWVGTQDGAAYYNGRQWNTLNMPNRSVSNYVHAIFVASDSAVWFAAARGAVHRYLNGVWTSFDTSSGLGGTIVRRIFETHEVSSRRTLWFATDRGLSVYADGKWRTATTRDGLAGDVVHDICQAAKNIVWVATDKGISEYVDGLWRPVDAPAGLRNAVVLRLLKSADGSVWAGGNAVIGRYALGRWQVFDVLRGTGDNGVYSICQGSNGDIWFGTQHGVWVFDHSKILHFVDVGIAASREANQHVWSVHESRDGSLWFGTFLGLYRYKRGTWQILDAHMGAREGGTTSLCEASHGDFWFGTEQGLLRFHNGTWQVIPEIRAPVLSLEKTVAGELWVSVNGMGMYRYRHRTWDRFTKAHGLASNSTWCIRGTRSDAVWFGSDAGASRFAQDRWETFTTREGLAANTVLSICETGDGTLWFGTTNGVSRYRHGAWRTFDTRDRLAGHVVYSIHESRDSVLWFGTASGGVSRFDPRTGTWQTYNDATSPALSNNVVLAIAEDRLGRLYFLTNKGITRFAFLKDGTIEPDAYTTEDGLPNNEGIQGASMLDSRGRVWVGTTEGAAFLDLAQEMSDTVKKPIAFEHVLISNFPTDQSPTNGLTLAHTQNSITFEFALLSLFKESETQYQVKLDGYDELPQQWTSDSKKGYTNLPEGEYLFSVWGRDYAGNVSGPATFAFVIQPPFWNTWWFRTSSALLAFGAAVVIVRMYTARKVRKRTALLERQQMIERERTRISKDMHDTIGSSLTRIAILSDRVGKEMARESQDEHATVEERVTLIGVTAREVIDTMNEIIWSLSPKYDSLESLINYTRQFVNNMFEPTGIQYLFNVSDAIPDVTLSPDFRRNAFLILKEAVNNVIRHSHASSASVSISLSGSRVKFEVMDDGIGFSESAASVRGKPGFGIKSMRERAVALGTVLEITSAPRSGTIVSFCAALKTIPPN